MWLIGRPYKAISIAVHPALRPGGHRHGRRQTADGRRQTADGLRAAGGGAPTRGQRSGQCRIRGLASGCRRGRLSAPPPARLRPAASLRGAGRPTFARTAAEAARQGFRRGGKSLGATGWIGQGPPPQTAEIPTVLQRDPERADAIHTDALGERGLEPGQYPHRFPGRRRTPAAERSTSFGEAVRAQRQSAGRRQYRTPWTVSGPRSGTTCSEVEETPQSADSATVWLSQCSTSRNSAFSTARICAVCVPNT
ncbi:hypothetical protein SMA5143A_8053 [Streptomyces sp. MA5143a]|nr:hypothetical protein SMA5143A_8053 [Streptomyces sp. MA5143a]